MVERIIEVIIRDVVNVDVMQFGFIPGRGTTGAIFILRQIQEKYIGKNRNLYFAFVDLEKAFDRVPKEVPMVGFKKSRDTRVDCACSSIFFFFFLYQQLHIKPKNLQLPGINIYVAIYLGTIKYTYKKNTT